MTPLSSAESAPVNTAQLHEWAALTHAQGSTYNPYFPPLPATGAGGGTEPKAPGAHHAHHAATHHHAAAHEEYAAQAQMVQ